VSATEYFNGPELGQLRRCYDRLWRVRHHLHWAAGRAEERLGFDLQPEIARRMGFADSGRSGTAGVERFMRRYFVNAREVGALTRVFCAKLEAEQAKAAPSGLSRFAPALLPARRVDVKGFRVRRGRLTVRGPEVFERDPVNLLRLFRTADARDLDLHPEALAHAGRGLPLITREVRRDQDAAAVFLDVLTRGRRPFRTLSLMNDAGVLGRFVPEFGRIVSRTQLDRHHAYTVDEHTLRMAGLLADIRDGREREAHPLATAVMPRIADPEVLALAVLLHDVGKGGEGGQLVAGGRHAARACARLGLSSDRVELVVWLVENHLLMSDYAQRRDVSDPGTVAAFAEAVGGLERLRLLLVLTVCDIRSSAPVFGTPGKAGSCASFTPPPKPPSAAAVAPIRPAPFAGAARIGPPSPARLCWRWSRKRRSSPPPWTTPTSSSSPRPSWPRTRAWWPGLQAAAAPRRRFRPVRSTPPPRRWWPPPTALGCSPT
jgi:[protein-PII] uridylyltransferase